MGQRLNGCVIAVLATNGVEQVEAAEPVAALQREGVEVHVASDKKDRIQGFRRHDRSDKIKMGLSLDTAEADKCVGLVDGNLVTSREPDDLPAFNAKLIEMLERAARRPSAAK
jgi:putative intracellular protease/amidase